MSADSQSPDRVVKASREIAAPCAVIFELIADPAQQPRWDGNGNLAEASPGQRVTEVGSIFRMKLTKDGAVRVNQVTEFDEGHRIAWLPAPPNSPPPGHLWRWELDPIDDERTKVTHTYDWTRLDDPQRLEKARSTTVENLMASLDRLAELAEAEAKQ